MTTNSSNSTGPWVPQQRFTPGVGAHETTPDTPHRPASSFRQIDNPLGYEEKRLGMGGSIGSERHTQDLMNGMSVVVILAAALVSSAVFPPLFIVWVIIAIWFGLVQILIPIGRRQLAHEELVRQQQDGTLPTAQAQPAQPWTPGAQP